MAAEAAEELGLGGRWPSGSSNRSRRSAKDADFFRFAADIHETNESWQKAIACWEQVKKLNPNDQDVSRQINALSAAGDDQAGRPRRRAGQAGARPQAADEPPRRCEAKLERLKQEQLTPEQRLVKEIVADPTAIHAYVELAEHLPHRTASSTRRRRSWPRGSRPIPTTTG